MRELIIAGGLVFAAALGGCSSDAPSMSAAATPVPSRDARVVDVRPPPIHAGFVYRAGIPVLVFHAICEDACAAEETYGVTRSVFAQMMLTVGQAGYATISMADFARAHAGDPSGLPERPILVTFDDGRIDAYRGADDVLREHGFQATMFVITAEADRNPTFRMQWPQIREAAASGRWTIQLHAHAGHVQVEVGRDPAGAPKLGAFYGWRECDPLAVGCASLESFEAWKDRAEADIEKGDARLASELGPAAYESLSFAVPFSDYGQNHSNDARISIELRAFLNAHFEVWFTQPSADPEPMTPSDTVHEVGRYLVQSTTSLRGSRSMRTWRARHRARAELARRGGLAAPAGGAPAGSLPGCGARSRTGRCPNGAHRAVERRRRGG